MVAVDNRRMECLTQEEAQRLLNVAQADRNPHIYLKLRNKGIQGGSRRSFLLKTNLKR